MVRSARILFCSTTTNECLNICCKSFKLVRNMPAPLTGDRGPIAIWARLRSLTLRCNLTMFISGHDSSSTSLALNQAPPSISEGLIFNTPTSLLPSWPPGVSRKLCRSAKVFRVRTSRCSPNNQVYGTIGYKHEHGLLSTPKD